MENASSASRSMKFMTSVTWTATGDWAFVIGRTVVEVCSWLMTLVASLSHLFDHFPYNLETLNSSCVQHVVGEANHGPNPLRQLAFSICKGWQQQEAHCQKKSYRNIAGKGVFQQTNQCPHPVRVQNPKGVGWSGILDTQMTASRFHELLNTYAPCRRYFSHILLWHCPSSPTTLWETYQPLCLSLWLPKVFQDLVYTWTKAKGGGGGGGLRGIIGSVLW